MRYRTRTSSSRHTTHKTLTTWRTITCLLSETHDSKTPGWIRISISVISPAGAPLPIADSGQADQRLDADELAAAGGIEAFFIRRLDREATSTRYAKALFNWRQGALF